MAGGTYSNNTTLKVSAAIAASVTGSFAGSDVVYTVPANSYAIVRVICGSANVNVVIACYSQTGSNFGSSGQEWTLGPGQVVNGTANSGSDTIRVIGVLLANSP